MVVTTQNVLGKGYHIKNLFQLTGDYSLFTSLDWYTHRSWHVSVLGCYATFFDPRYYTISVCANLIDSVCIRAQVMHRADMHSDNTCRHTLWYYTPRSWLQWYCTTLGISGYVWTITLTYTFIVTSYWLQLRLGTEITVAVLMHNTTAIEVVQVYVTFSVVLRYYQIS